MFDYLLLAFYIIVGIQVIYYFTFLSPILGKQQNDNRNSTPISVIVYIKNGAVNLQKNLTQIVNQSYKGSIEFVLINDRSSDDTADVIESFSLLHDNIKVVTVNDCENFWGNKKYAITLGIKAATYEHLILTNADCKPNSNNWIKQMASSFSNTKSLVLGHNRYEKNKGSFINKLIRFENVVSNTKYFSFAKLGNAYGGTSKNLAYTKTEFFSVNGFIKHIDIKPGSADLFINEVATSKNTAINIHPESFTCSAAPTSIKEWIKFKRNEISTFKFYKFQHKALLSIFNLTQILFLLLSIILFLSPINYKIILIPFTIRYLISYVNLGLSSKKLKEQDIILLLPILEISSLFFGIFIYLKNKISGVPVNWN